MGIISCADTASWQSLRMPRLGKEAPTGTMHSCPKPPRMNIMSPDSAASVERTCHCDTRFADRPWDPHGKKKKKTKEKKTTKKKKENKTKKKKEKQINKEKTKKEKTRKGKH